VVGRAIMRKGGLPRFMIKYIINDLVDLGLLIRINSGEYKVRENNCHKRIKQLVASYY